ncbi:unnamed protein product [Prunus brigantina]
MLTSPFPLSKSHQLRDNPSCHRSHPTKQGVAGHAPSYAFSRPKTLNSGEPCKYPSHQSTLSTPTWTIKGSSPLPSKRISCYFFMSPRAVQSSPKLSITLLLELSSLSPYFSHVQGTNSPVNKEYGRQEGFWIRTLSSSKIRRCLDEVTSRQFVCAHEGKYVPKNTS